MNKISLNSYSIKLWNNKEGEYLMLDDVTKVDSNKKITLVSLFEEYLKSRKLKSTQNQEYKKVIHVEKANISKILGKGNIVKYTYINGIIESGNYGYSSEFIDVVNGNTVYKRDVSHAEMLPFYFNIGIQNSRTKGICILQNFRQYGIKTIFVDDFNNFLQIRYPNIELRLGTLLPKEYVKNFLNEGRLLKIRCIRYDIPKDIADRYSLVDGSKESDIYDEYVINAKRNRKISNIKNDLIGYIESKKNISKIIEIRDFEYNKIKVEIELNGSRKVLDFSNFDNLNSSFDITDEIEIGKNGHPILKSIDNIAKIYLEQFLEDIGM